MQDTKMIENKLPKDWKYKRFVDICIPKEGLKRGPFGSSIKKEFFVPDGNKVYEQSNAIYDDAFRGKYFIDNEKYNELINFNVIPGDIIVSCSGTLGRISVIPPNAKKGIINQALLRIRIIESIVSKKFFLYFFRSADFQRKILVQSQGTAITNMVGMKDFKEIEIPLPSLETQNLIVSKIEELFSELDKGIEDLKTAQQQLKTYRQSVLKWAFEGKLTNEWREKKTDLYTVDVLLDNIKNDKKHLRTKSLSEISKEESEELFDIPKSWKWVRNEVYLYEVKDGTHDTPKYVNDGIPFITQKNIKEVGLILDDVQYISKEDHNKFYQRSNVGKGDILISMIGHNRGMTVIVDSDEIFSIKNVGLFKFNNKHYVIVKFVNF
jgi:type I restriction enzyme S subunit